VIIADSETAKRLEASPIGRIVSWGIAGVDRKSWVSGLFPLRKSRWNAAGLKLSDIDRVEVNEAFAVNISPLKSAGIGPQQNQRQWRCNRVGHPLEHLEPDWF